MIAFVARELHTSIDVVESWELDQIVAYQASIGRISPKPKKR